jgi:hypothetical protein
MGHVVSTLLLSGLIVAVAGMTVPWIAPVTSRAALAVGILWMALTLAFEFGAGHCCFTSHWRNWSTTTI